VWYQVQAVRVGLDIRGSGELAIKTKMTARITTTIIGLQSLIRMREHRVAAEMQLPTKPYFSRKSGISRARKKLKYH